MSFGALGFDGLGIGLAASTFAYGLRHGIDWDHIAAIADVTGTQRTPRRALWVASAYAAGHGAVVFALGLLAIVAGDYLPAGFDALMGRVVGVTLIALSVSIVVGLLRQRSDFRLRSRWMLVAAGLGRARRWAAGRVVEIRHEHPHPHTSDGEGHGHTHDDPASDGHVHETVLVGHSHEHRHVAVEPDDPFVATTTRAATLLGVVHGVGAETPTQIVVFLAAAQIAGGAGAVALLVLFIAGIFTSNSAVAVAASFGVLNASRSFTVYAAVALVSAAFSLAVGLVFLIGGTLPTILG